MSFLEKPTFKNMLLDPNFSLQPQPSIDFLFFTLPMSVKRKLKALEISPTKKLKDAFYLYHKVRVKIPIK
jgi:hypothetical protein